MHSHHLQRPHMPEHKQLITQNTLSKRTQILDDYTRHELSDLKNAALMDRVDTKFMLPISYLALILEELMPHYSVLDIEDKRIFTYHNTYFDTPDYSFYHMHHQGKLNRYKVRHRYYTDTHTGFLEVKFKNNKGRTIKTRMANNEAYLDQSCSTFLASQLGEHFRTLQASQKGSYQRIALANEQSSERLTLDLNLHFESFQQGNNEYKHDIDLPQMFIAELKQNRHNIHSPFAQLMARLNIRPVNFSKYCIGCSLLTPNLKKNRFKPQLRSLQKLH